MLGLGKEAVIEFAKKNGYVMVRGWKSGENGYLLAEKPRGQLPPLSLGQGAIVRMEKKGIVYGMAVIFKDLLRKTNLCHFAFQDSVVARTLRDAERVQCLLPASIRRTNHHAAPLGDGIIVDLSKGGLRFVTRTPLQLEPDDELSVSFHPGGMGFMDRQKIRLKRVNGSGGRFEYAAQFVELDAKNAKLLNEYFVFCKAWAL